MTFSEISSLRLINQQISVSNLSSAKDIVHWMGAMQAQDYIMAKWAIGVRLPGSTDKIIEAAIDKGEILRTHLLRPTWHFVAASDIQWMLELTAPHIKASIKTRLKQLELTETVLNSSKTIIEKALTGGKHLTRDEIKNELEKSGIKAIDERTSHIMAWAELEGLVCSGPNRNKQRTYALLAERVPKTEKVNREEALARLAKRYFTSHGPATIQDFAWWSGLNLTNAKKALEMVKSGFVSETIDAQTYWFSNGFSISDPVKKSIYVLPAYDEFIISYKDRIAVLSPEENKKAISNNGIFRPVIVINGQVTGIWTRNTKKDKTVVETNLFIQKQASNKGAKEAIEKAFLAYGSFINQKLEINHN